MTSPTGMNAGEPALDASVDGMGVPPKDHQCDGGDHELGFGWAPKEDLSDAPAAGSFFFDDDISPPIPIDPRYYEDPTGDEDEVDSNVLKLIPDICSTSVCDLCAQVAPVVGGLSYCYFSLSNVDPVWFGKAFGGLQGRASNLLWLQAHLGAGFYIWTRRHIRTMPPYRAALYSILGSVIFNFGSCMVWGLGRALLRNSPNGCRLFGLASSCLLLYAGQDYLQAVDDRCSELD